MSTAASSSTPTVIAHRYELQRQLAQGGMAEVWLAVDLTLDRKVAVKWLKPNARHRRGRHRTLPP